MPLLRYPWHLARCPDYKARKENGLPIYKCKNHTLHIFLNRQALELHLPICDAKPKEEKESLVGEEHKERSPLKEVKPAVLGKRERD